jgi:hypothetical protein
MTASIDSAPDRRDRGADDKCIADPQRHDKPPLAWADRDGVRIVVRVIVLPTVTAGEGNEDRDSETHAICKATAPIKLRGQLSRPPRRARQTPT